MDSQFSASPALNPRNLSHTLASSPKPPKKGLSILGPLKDRKGGLTNSRTTLTALVTTGGHFEFRTVYSSTRFETHAKALRVGGER